MSKPYLASLTAINSIPQQTSAQKIQSDIAIGWLRAIRSNSTQDRIMSRGHNPLGIRQRIAYWKCLKPTRWHSPVI